MTDGADDVPKGTAILRDLPPEAVTELFKSLLERIPTSPPVPPPAPPSGSMTGADARSIVQHPDADIDALERVVSILLMAKGMTREQIGEFVGNKTSSFLTGDQIDARIDRKIGERLQTIGLPIDEDHIEETSEAVRSAMKWHKRIDKVVAGMAISVLGAIGYALLNLVGIRLPSTGGH